MEGEGESALGVPAPTPPSVDNVGIPELRGGFVDEIGEPCSEEAARE